MPADYDELGQNTANYVPLSPVSFLDRTADIYPNRDAVVYNERRYSWSEVRARCRRFASALKSRGIGKNDTISLLTFNTPEMFECHFSVPMAGAVLNTINTRLDAGTVAYIIDHGETKMFIVDRELWPVLNAALKLCERRPEIIIVDDPSAATQPELPTENFRFYEDLVLEGDVTFTAEPLKDEWQALSLNYTSGTTGRPKGVVYHHRGAYLMSMGTVPSWGLTPHPRYLYTVPMFHCNGWGHAWTMTLMAAMAEFSFDVMHVYGLTETYGHILQSAPQDDWAAKTIPQQAELKARQGVRFAMTDMVDVVDENARSVPHDGETMGEIVIRGNTVMKGYLKDEPATSEAFKSGWFVSGDLGVIYPDGYIQLKDRSKDIIISGGENISSVEVETALYKHPAVDLAAVVAMPHSKWGEVPCAFVELKAEASEVELIDFCANNMARFKRPKRIIFGELPKTATGKIQKKELRDRAKAMSA